MGKTAKFLLAGVVLALTLFSVPANAGHDGCIALGTHAVQPLNQNPWDCRFIATGPTQFTAATTNPFVIAVSRDGGASWTEMFRRSTPGAPLGDTVPTLAGDLVSVSISCWNYVEARGCAQLGIGGRDGMIIAQSDV